MNETVLPGQQLAAERQRRGLSELDVSEKLKISRTYLRAIESDDYDRLPEAAFVKGYLRNYARLLELPDEEITQAFEKLVVNKPGQAQRTNPAGVAPVTAMPAGSKRKAAGILVLILAALVLGWFYWQAGRDARVFSLPQQPVPDAASTPAAHPVDPPDIHPTESNPDVSQEMPSANAPAQDTTTSLDELVIEFSGHCWLEVHEAETDQRLFSGEQAADTQLQLHGQAPFSLAIGNASAVKRVTLNGQDITLPPGAPGQALRVSVP